jgi:hypothetical protein
MEEIRRKIELVEKALSDKNVPNDVKKLYSEHINGIKKDPKNISSNHDYLEGTSIFLDVMYDKLIKLNPVIKWI